MTRRPPSRTPHGVRGLKFHALISGYDGDSRTPHGVRGLKCGRNDEQAETVCRTPHGVRGLKYDEFRHTPALPGSHPSRGAWIEMTRHVA